MKTGYRIALTYHLAVEGQPSTTTSPVSAAMVTALAQSIEQHFATARLPRWADDPRREPPDRLVYLLDHQYTRRSLGWHRLKGADLARAAALQEAAQRLDCGLPSRSPTSTSSGRARTMARFRAATAADASGTRRTKTRWTSTMRARTSWT